MYYHFVYNNYKTATNPLFLFKRQDDSDSLDEASNNGFDTDNNNTNDNYNNNFIHSLLMIGLVTLIVLSLFVLLIVFYYRFLRLNLKFTKLRFYNRNRNAKYKSSFSTTVTNNNATNSNFTELETIIVSTNNNKSSKNSSNQKINNNNNKIEQEDTWDQYIGLLDKNQDLKFVDNTNTTNLNQRKYSLVSPHDYYYQCPSLLQQNMVDYYSQIKMDNSQDTTIQHKTKFTNNTNNKSSKYYYRNSYNTSYHYYKNLNKNGHQQNSTTLPKLGNKLLENNSANCYNTDLLKLRKGSLPNNNNII